MPITTYEQEEVSTQGALGNRKGSRGLRVHPGVMQEASASFLSHTNSQCHTRLYRLRYSPAEFQKQSKNPCPHHCYNTPGSKALPD